MTKAIILLIHMRGVRVISGLLSRSVWIRGAPTLVATVARGPVTGV